MNILLIEDNETIVKGLKYAFEKNKYGFVCKSTVLDARNYLNSKKEVDLIVLDVNLPDGNGFKLYEGCIKQLNIPTIFLTVQDDEDDIVSGLNMGAEDYLTKPFSTKELLARVNKILLRAQKKNVIKVKDIKFDIDKMVVYKEDKVIDFTPLEITILSLLFENKGKVVSRNAILETIWDSTGNDVDDHTVTVYFKRIRQKLGTNIIITVKGLGYRIDDEK